MISTNSFKLALTLLLVLPVFSIQAATLSVKCDKKSLADVIGKLDKSELNTINITSDCNEDIVISGHKDLTLIGHDGASLSATTFLPGDSENSTSALLVENSHITVQTLTINPGRDVTCTSRSTCVFRDVTIQGGHNGVRFQDQSAGDILGSSVIQNSLGTGLGIFGASTVNVRPDPWVTGNEVGPIISGNASRGVFVFDNSFLRTDNVTISNNGGGVFAQRESVIKILGGQVNNNLYEGIVIIKGGSAQIWSEVSNNGTDGTYDGIYVGALVFAQVELAEILGNSGLSVNCDHSTAVVDVGEATLDDTNCP
jgi:hypothetical protein